MAARWDLPEGTEMPGCDELRAPWRQSVRGGARYNAVCTQRAGNYGTAHSVSAPPALLHLHPHPHRHLALSPRPPKKEAGGGGAPAGRGQRQPPRPPSQQAGGAAPCKGSTWWGQNLEVLAFVASELPPAWGLAGCVLSNHHPGHRETAALRPRWAVGGSKQDH